MKIFFKSCLFIFGFLGMTCSVQAQYYRWVDTQGVRHFSDQGPQVKSEKKQNKSNSNDLSMKRDCLEARDHLELLKEGLWVSKKSHGPRGALNETEKKQAFESAKQQIIEHCGLAKEQI